MRGSTAGLADGVLNPRISFYAILLQLLDISYVTFVLATAVVTYWRGTWNLVTHYLYPDNPTCSAVASLLIGINGHLIFTGFQSLFRNSFNPDKHRLLYYVGSRCYTYVYGFVCVNGNDDDLKVFLAAFINGSLMKI